MLYYIRKLKEIHNILSINRLWRTRLYEIGIIIKDSCLYSGLTGLSSRPIQIIIDGRFTGYEFHEESNYSIFYPSIGDCLDRYILRINEIIECCRIIYSLFYIIDFFNYQLFILLLILLYLLFFMVFSFIPSLLSFTKFFSLIPILYQLISIVILMVIFPSLILYFLSIILFIIYSYI